MLAVYMAAAVAGMLAHGVTMPDRFVGAIGSGADQVPAEFQVPLAIVPTGARFRGSPPSRSRRFSAPSAKKPMERLSGDQKGAFAPSVPGNMVAEVVDSGRNQSRCTPAFSATNASCRPSGESAKSAGSLVSGVLISTRVSSGGVSRR